MFKLWATIKKDISVLFKDRIGVMFMFVMPIILAIVITAIQNSTFELVNNNKIKLLLANRDTGMASKQMIAAIEKIGMFEIKKITRQQTDNQIKERMHSKEALLAVIIPEDFSEKLNIKAKNIAGNALNKLGLQTDSAKPLEVSLDPLILYYHPVLQESFRASVNGALRSSLQFVQTKQILRNIYLSLNEKIIPDDLEKDITGNEIAIQEVAVSRDGSRNTPNATQHNIPAWTVFAMFFIVISLGSSVVREKLNGSFIRLKTLPTSFIIALLSKEITYLLITLLQAAVIFAIGIWLFPVMGLPKLNIPTDIIGLFIVSLICGWCAVSFAICVGVFAQTQEQANGIGAVSIIILAALGGLLVPSFAMPASFQFVMKFSPLHWCLESYYGLFLEGGKLKDILINILPLITITIFLQLIAIWGLKRKKLI
jgi:ABC-2 type transport system permease protein